MNQPEGDREEDSDPQTSRRVFLAGISATTLVTAVAAYRFVIGEDVESRVKSRVVRKFPSLFPRESTPEERRNPLNAAFAARYFDALEAVAVQMALMSSAELHHEENSVKKRAYNLFFKGESVTRTFADSAWLNFLVYSRLHVISQRTSPQSRLRFVDLVSERTLRQMETKPVRLTREQARRDADEWLAGLRRLLDELVSLGWISGYRVDEFDGGPGSLWQDESRSSLTVYAFDPVTIQAAQLIGEERYEEISPKLSGWMKAFLNASGIKTSLEDYYLDDAYRPDPEQYKPSQLATQFDLSL